MKKLTAVAVAVFGLMPLGPALGQQPLYTGADYADLVRGAAANGNSELQNVLRSFTPILLKGPTEGDSDSVYVSGDLDTEIDWNARADQRVKLRDEHHVVLTFEQLQELARRRQALNAAGVMLAPPAPQGLIEAEASEEAAYWSTRQSPTGNSEPQAAVAPITSEPQTSVPGPAQPQALASTPSVANRGSLKESGEDRQSLQDSLLPWIGNNLRLITTVLVAFFIIDLFRSTIRKRSRCRPLQDPRVRPGFGMIEYGVPHCRFELANTKHGKGFKVTLKSVSYSSILGGFYISFFGGLFVWAMYLLNGATNAFLTTLIILSALTYLVWKRALRLSLIEVTVDTITINNVPMERKYFGQFQPGGKGDWIGYDYGGRLYGVPGGWNRSEVTEITSALNMQLMRPIVAVPEASPTDLRGARPADF